MNAMEHARNWMWARRKLSGRSHVLATRSSYNDSWEEQAFAEDSSGALGGCIWPPRSYSCSFCRREFRSAQALGGHMNVHRRDRARLKQSPNDKESPCTQLGIEYPPQVCTMVCNPNSNPNPNIVASTLSPSRVSAPCVQGNSHEVLVSQSFSPSFLQQNQKRSFFSPHHTDSVRSLDILDLKLERENTRLSKMGCQLKRIKPDSAISTLDLVGHQSQEEDSVSDEEEISAKRRRIDKSLPLFCKSEVGKGRVDTSLPFFVKPSPYDRHQLQSEVHGLSCSPMEDLDLELRLGHRPNIK